MEKGGYLIRSLELQLEAVRPQIAPFSPNEVCLAAARTLVERGEKLVNECIQQGSLLDVPLNDFNYQRIDLVGYYADLLGNGQRSLAEIRALDSEQNKMLSPDEYLQPHRNLAREGNCSALLQTEIFKMMENQTPEAKKAVLVDHNVFSQHLQSDSLKTRPTVLLEEKQRGAINSAFLPPELATMIYSHCDLETCVNLRQVNAVFYSVYYHCEPMLQTKLRKKVPWFQLETDISTWADCVLVFVKRLTGTTKWKTTKNISNVKVQSKPSSVKYVLARHVERDGGDILDNPPIGFRSYPKRVDYNVGEAQVDVNGDTVFQVKGKTVTLPPLAILQATEPVVAILGDTVVVKTATSVFVLPWAESHYNKALATSIQSGESGEYFLELALGIVACYNGLLWWWGDSEPRDDLVPTFIDLDNPGTIYYREDKIITVTDRQGSEFFQYERTKDGTSRFALFGSHRGFNLVDLATGQVTEVLHDIEKVYEFVPSDFFLVPAYVDGKIDMRYMMRDGHPDQE